MKAILDIFTHAGNAAVVRNKGPFDEGSGIGYTYYSDGSIQSQLMIDGYGTPLDYVHFMDTAPSRADKSINFSDGTSYAYSYYSAAGRRFKSVVYFKDTNWTRFAALFTFYDDETNHRQSMRLAMPDADGNVYYHYLDDEILTDSDIPGDYWGPGSCFCGRVDKEVRAKADAEGAVAYEYIYYAGTEKVHYKKCYASAYWFDQSDPELQDIIMTIIYGPDGKILKEVRPVAAIIA